jgi:hypothetical protein
MEDEGLSDKDLNLRIILLEYQESQGRLSETQRK